MTISKQTTIVDHTFENSKWSTYFVLVPKDWSEAQRPGIYFLLEKQTAETGDRAYIGESENVVKRLIFSTEDGKEPFVDWLNSIKDTKALRGNK